MIRAIHHLTLMTGHTRLSPRSEVRDRTIASIRPAVLAGGGRLEDTGWRIKMIRGEAEGGAAFECHYEHGRRSLWVASCYMAWDDAGSDEMWQAALTHSLLSPSTRRPASLPWLAAAIMPEAFGHPGLLFEVADLERCIAWTVLDVCRPADIREAELTLH